MEAILQLMHDVAIKGEIKLTVTAEYVAGEGIVFSAQLQDQYFTYPDSYEGYTDPQEAFQEAIAEYHMVAPRN